MPEWLKTAIKIATVIPIIVEGIKKIVEKLKGSSS